MTEQNYLDPAQSEPVSQVQMQEMQRQIARLLERIADLERKLAQAQGGEPLAT